MEKLAEGLQKLDEDSLLLVVQMIHDNKTESTYVKNDVERKIYPIFFPLSIFWAVANLNTLMQRENSMSIYIPFPSLYRKTYGNLFRRKECTRSTAMPKSGGHQRLQVEEMILNNSLLILTFFCLPFHVSASIVSRYFFICFHCLES